MVSKAPSRLHLDSQSPDAPNRFDGWRIVAVSALLQGLCVGLGFYFFAQIVTAVQAEFETSRAGIMPAPTR